MKKMTFTIQRFDPAKDAEPHNETYTVSVNEGARVLDALDEVRRSLDPSLMYRSCCRAGQCGSCAVRVNGNPTLACMEEATDGMVVLPLELPVIRDLATDIAPVLERLATILPSDSPGGLSKEEVALIKPLRECIECLSCVSACPALKVVDFAGPTAMRQEMRCALDPRDSGDRITEAIGRGLFACTTCHRCVEVCPKEIEIPGKAIEKLRERANRAGLTLPRHQAVAELIERADQGTEGLADSELSSAGSNGVVVHRAGGDSDIGQLLADSVSARDVGALETCLDEGNVLGSRAVGKGH